jgi:cell division protein FtsZ
MPNVEELPIVAQNAIKAKSGEAPPAGLAAQKRKVGFLERLANVGRGRKSADAEMSPKLEPEFGARQAPPEMAQPQAPAATRGIRIERPRGESVAPKRIDAQPRVAVAEIPLPSAESRADDDLEIPAFLRRRAN